MAKLTKEQRSNIMRHVRSKDTTPEKVLRLALWHRGIRYRKNYRKVSGTPDIALTRYRIAIFVDGDFWHARGHEANLGEQITSNIDYWKKKLTRNVERDKEVNDMLTEDGWLVLRFWESDIKKDIETCIERILRYLP